MNRPLSYRAQTCAFAIFLLLGAWTMSYLLHTPYVSSKSSTLRGVIIPSDMEIIKSTMCEPGGKCNEDPSILSARTVYSSSSQDQFIKWYKMHQFYVASASEPQSFRADSSPVMLIGDSITESWMGTSMGIPNKKHAGGPAALEYLSDRLNESSDHTLIVNGISGDQTQHVLWRLANGEMPSDIATHPGATFVVLIGTNNIGSGHLPGSTVRGIETVVRYLLEKTHGRVLLLKLLPLGDGYGLLQKLCPPRCDKEGNPFKSFLPPIQKVNDGLEMFVEKKISKGGKDSMSSRLRLVDCGEGFKGRGDKEDVNEDWMPDKVHPNGEGLRYIAKCISREILVKDWAKKK